MYFNFEDYRPDTPTLPRSLTRLEVSLLTLVIYLSVIILLLIWPQLPFVKAMEAKRQQQLAEIERKQLEKQRENARFVFMEPKVDLRAPKPPERAELSDIDRKARTVERAEKPKNDMPFARGNSPERMESPPSRETQPRGTPAARSRHGGAAGAPGRDASRFAVGARAQSDGDASARAGRRGDRRCDPERAEIRDERDLRQPCRAERICSPRRPSSSTRKGVDFGPWLRRFIAQIRRNWFIPLAAQTLRGHVVITFYVGKDGRITELRVLRPSDVDAFNNSSFNALAASNPTQPLPPEYPDDRAFFTITFYYNETPGT